MQDTLVNAAFLSYARPQYHGMFLANLCLRLVHNPHTHPGVILKASDQEDKK